MSVTLEDKVNKIRWATAESGYTQTSDGDPADVLVEALQITEPPSRIKDDGYTVDDLDGVETPKLNYLNFLKAYTGEAFGIFQDNSTAPTDADKTFEIKGTWVVDKIQTGSLHPDIKRPTEYITSTDYDDLVKYLAFKSWYRNEANRGEVNFSFYTPRTLQGGLPNLNSGKRRIAVPAPGSGDVDFRTKQTTEWCNNIAGVAYDWVSDRVCIYKRFPSDLLAPPVVGIYGHEGRGLAYFPTQVRILPFRTALGTDSEFDDLEMNINWENIKNQMFPDDLFIDPVSGYAETRSYNLSLPLNSQSDEAVQKNLFIPTRLIFHNFSSAVATPAGCVWFTYDTSGADGAALGVKETMMWNAYKCRFEVYDYTSVSNTIGTTSNVSDTRKDSFNMGCISNRTKGGFFPPAYCYILAPNDLDNLNESERALLDYFTPFRTNYNSLPALNWGAYNTDCWIPATQPFFSKMVYDPINQKSYFVPHGFLRADDGYPAVKVDPDGTIDLLEFKYYIEPPYAAAKDGTDIKELYYDAQYSISEKRIYFFSIYDVENGYIKYLDCETEVYKELAIPAGKTFKGGGHVQYCPHDNRIYIAPHYDDFANGDFAYIDCDESSYNFYNIGTVPSDLWQTYKHSFYSPYTGDIFFYPDGESSVRTSKSKLFKIRGNGTRLSKAIAGIVGINN